MSRLELVTECKHGQAHSHPLPGDEKERGKLVCHEGSRIPLDPDRVIRTRLEDVTVQHVLDVLEDV